MIHILLINSNPVVSRLFDLCMREAHFELEEAAGFQDIGREKYDILFVDEEAYTDEAKALLPGIKAAERVLLSKSLELTPEAKAFDRLVKKPFLPSQIMEVVERYGRLESEEEAEALSAFFPLSAEEEHVEAEEEQPQNDPKVLDPGEIERIKALLDMDEEEAMAELPSSEEELENRKVEVIKQQLIADGLEIVDEEEIVEALSKAPKRKKEKSKKRKKRKKEPKVKKNEVAEAGFEEALLAAVREMKVKKIKKLLKGAEVTLKIKFKDKE
jgi:hypothetical protein